MKIVRILKAAMCVLLAAAISSSSGYISVKSQLRQGNASTVVQNSVKTLSSNSYKQKSDYADITTKTADELKEKNDVIYTPSKNEITVLKDGGAYVNDVIDIFFTDDASKKEINNVIKAIDGKAVGYVETLNEYEVKIKHSSANTISNTCDELIKNDNIEYATLSTVGQYSDMTIPQDPWNGTSDTEWSDDASKTNSNWWVKAVDGDKAWDYNEYYNNINVGIVDDGFDTEHEDLKGKITFPNSYFERTNRPNYHGTHVAGIIGADANNNTGISGLCWKSSLTCVDWEPEGNQLWMPDLRIITGFVYTVKAGAKVVNFSIGDQSPILSGRNDRSKFILDATAKLYSYVMAKLIKSGYDYLVVQSAGNGLQFSNDDTHAIDAKNNGLFSAVTQDNAVSFVDGVTPKDIYDRILIVASVQNDEQKKYTLSSFSNYGSNISICAPGSLVYSTYYKNGSDNSTYAYLSGTSMAAPVVTAIAAMVWSVNSKFTAAQVKEIVCSRENTKYDVLPNQCDDSGVQYRMINAELSVKKALELSGYTVTIDDSGNVTVKPWEDGGVIDGEAQQDVGNTKADKAEAVTSSTEAISNDENNENQAESNKSVSAESDISVSDNKKDDIKAHFKKIIIKYFKQLQNN